ncbi:unnamed protein product, partial [Didymodactylos carnosus]
MSDSRVNNMGPVMDATPEIQEISERPEIKHAAINALHKKHRENRIHHFTEAHKEGHLSAWTVIKYAEEDAAYGINYFMKVSIGDGLFIHIRVHRRENENIYDFYSLHETFKHNTATCVFTEVFESGLHDHSQRQENNRLKPPIRTAVQEMTHQGLIQGQIRTAVSVLHPNLTTDTKIKNVHNYD